VGLVQHHEQQQQQLQHCRQGLRSWSLHPCLTAARTALLLQLPSTAQQVAAAQLQLLQHLVLEIAI
jgi:hypothetical protein